MKNSLQKGFTLIELLVVIAIIAILSAIVITSLSPAQKKAKVAAFQAEVRSAAAGFVIACDDDEVAGNAIFATDTKNVLWSDTGIDITDTGCENQLGAFIIDNIPAAGGLDCVATITDGNVTFGGADCA